MPWPRAASSSRTPTATRRSACRRGPVWPPATTSTASVAGTVPPPMTAASLHGITGCATPDTTWCRSGSCTTAGPTTDNGMSEVHHPIYIVDGIGDTRQTAAPRQEGARGGPRTGRRSGARVVALHSLRHQGGRCHGALAARAQGSGDGQAVGAVLLDGIAPLPADGARRVLRAVRRYRSAAARGSTAKRTGRTIR